MTILFFQKIKTKQEQICNRKKLFEFWSRTFHLLFFMKLLWMDEYAFLHKVM